MDAASVISELDLRRVRAFKVELNIDVKKRFLRFILLTFFTFFSVFFIFQTFLFKKNVGKLQSGKQINKKPFQNNSNEIDL